MHLKTLCFHTVTAHGHKLFQSLSLQKAGWGNTDLMFSPSRMLMPLIQGRGSKDERVQNPAVLVLRLRNFSYCVAAKNQLFFLVLLCLCHPVT